MNPDTPSGRRRSSGSVPGAPDNAAATDLGSTPLGSGLEPSHGSAELPDRPGEGDAADRKRGILKSVKNTAASQLNAQKSRATDELDRIADNVRQSTRRLRDENHGAVAAALDRGVNELERLTTTLRQRDIDDFLRDLEAFARRQPALFLGSSLAAGVLLARFAKADDGGRGPRRDRESGVGSAFHKPGRGFTGQESL